MRPSWVEIDLGAVEHNVRALGGVVAPSKLWAVVKADAYGHGDAPIASAALDAGATGLAVALVEEAVRLREAGVDAPILLLSEPALEDVGALAEWEISSAAYRPEFIASLPAGAPPVHVKVDTGMHRVGTDAAEAIAMARRLGPRLGGLWTHLAVAEEDPEFTRTQIDRFDRTAAQLVSSGITPPVLHVANTAGALAYPGSRKDVCRVGLGVYGLYPAPDLRPRVDLYPVMRVVSHVSHVRRHPAGSRPSYGRRRALAADANVASIPIGYADGVPRAWSDEGCVLIRGKRFPLAGTVTMDQLVVDVGNEPIEVGDPVVLIGRQGSQEITADEWAAASNTISYEIVCGIGPRLPRRYRS